MAVWMCGAGIASARAAGTQDAQKAPVTDENGQTTLKVYTNLIQIPVLVLGPNRDRLKEEIPGSKFMVSIDSGPWFKATHVRREGDDPIALSILLDVRGKAAEDTAKVGEKLSGMVPALHERDHVTVYGLDCSLTRGPVALPATEEMLKKSVDLALHKWQARMQAKPVQPCAQQGGLVKALMVMMNEMNDLPGRHVILAATDGQDAASRQDWIALENDAQLSAAAVFGLVTFQLDPELVAAAHMGSQYRANPNGAFNEMCELSGGMMMSSSGSTKDVLNGFVRMVRERYIVEFPRPSNATEGKHIMDVKVDKSNDFIRMAGISVPMQDPALQTDPNTLSAGPANTPIQGDKRPPEKK